MYAEVVRRYSPAMPTSSSHDPTSATGSEGAEARSDPRAQTHIGTPISTGDHAEVHLYVQGRLSAEQTLGVLRIEIHGSWSVADLIKLLGRLERAMLETCGSAGKGPEVKEGVPSR